MGLNLEFTLYDGSTEKVALPHYEFYSMVYRHEELSKFRHLNCDNAHWEAEDEDLVDLVRILVEEEWLDEPFASSPEAITFTSDYKVIF